MKRLASWLCIAGLLVSSSLAKAATPDQVEKALQKAKEFLYSKQNAAGNWEEVQQRDPKGGQADTKGWQWGGLTSIVTYALLASGESPQEPRLKKAVDFLKKAEITGIYALGLRCQVWHLLPDSPEVRLMVKRDAKILLMAVNKTGRATAMYNYYLNDGNKQRVDHSSSQYGVLGMWALEQSGQEVNMDYWRGVDTAWKSHQLSDGGWSYEFRGAGADPDVSKMSMTAAGVATLFITQDYLRASSVGCTGNVSSPNIEKGLDWVTKHFDQVKNGSSGWPLYTLYGIERIGVASGYKYFGDVDWYQLGADRLVKIQSPTGSWNDAGELPGTSFAMLFLARGRAPVVMNKLQYDKAEGDKPGTWNQRGRDVANITRWIGRQAERDLNWQIVNLSRPVEDLSDAAILYIAGNDAPKLTPEETTKLKTFIENGGMIVANADCGSAAFTTGLRKIGGEMFPGREFRELPADHVIYTNEQFQRTKWKTKPSVLSLSNDVRELITIIPTADPAKAWQLQSDKGREELYQLMANIFLYSVDKQGLKYKGATHLVLADPKIKADRTVKLARIEYNGNWNPEPGGWRRMTNVMLNEKKVGLTVQSVKLAPNALNGYQIAHLTGTTRFKLDSTAHDELKRFINAGGTLVVDAAGGSTEFATSVENELRGLFPAQAAELDQPLKPEHKIFTIPDASITDVTYRTFARINLKGNTKWAQLRGMTINNRTAVIYSREDLSAGLVGNAIDGVLGYDPATATKLMRNIILFAGAPK